MVAIVAMALVMTRLSMRHRAYNIVYMKKTHTLPEIPFLKVMYLAYHATLVFPSSIIQH